MKFTFSKWIFYFKKPEKVFGLSMRCREFEFIVLYMIIVYFVLYIIILFKYYYCSYFFYHNYCNFYSNIIFCLLLLYMYLVTFSKSADVTNFWMSIAEIISYLKLNRIRDHPFKSSENFHDFWPLPPSPPTIGIPAKCLWRGFLILMYCDLLTIGTWGHPSPPKTCWRL